jgi:hypothetical protein
VQREPMSASLEAPAPLVTNVAVPTLRSKRRSVSFLPDMIIVREGRTLAAVDYQHCDVRAEVGRFIEDGSVPRDAVQVASTWRYVNKNGTPDRRFKNNRQLPVLQYGTLTVSSVGGFHSVWQVSRSGAVSEAGSAIRGMRSATVPQAS